MSLYASGGDNIFRVFHFDRHFYIFNVNILNDERKEYICAFRREN